MLDENKDDILKSIADHLILNSSGLYEIGLYDGKMGVALFFYHYSRYMNVPIYNDFADCLLDEVIQNMDSLISIRFDEGLCGIGWALQYLMRNNFVKGDDSDVFSDFDCKVLEYDINKMSDRTLSTGSMGVLYYIIPRIFSLKQRGNSSVICDEMMNMLNSAILKEVSLCDFTQYSSIESILNLSILNHLWSDICFDRSKINKFPLGIDKGLSGIGLNTLL